MDVGEAVGVDCEGVNLGRYAGQLTLVQIITADGNIYLFDVLINPEIMTCEGGLGALLQADHITKARDTCLCLTFEVKLII